MHVKLNPWCMVWKLGILQISAKPLSFYLSTWVGLFRLLLDFRIQISQKAIEKRKKKGFEMHFECDFPPFTFRIQTLARSHQCKHLLNFFFSFFFSLTLSLQLGSVNAEVKVPPLMRSQSYQRFPLVSLEWVFWALCLWTGIQSFWVLCVHYIHLHFIQVLFKHKLAYVLTDFYLWLYDFLFCRWHLKNAQQDITSLCHLQGVGL